MTSQAPRLWRHLLAGLTQASSAGPDDDVASRQLAMAHQMQSQMLRQPSMPKAVLKKLVLDMQVGFVANLWWLL